MRIQNFSIVLAFPFLIALAYVGYMAFTGHREYALWLIPIVIILTIIYVFQYQLDQWWIKRYPVPLNDKDRSILMEHSKFYHSLSEEDKLKFDTRVSSFIRVKEFMAVGQTETREVPYDIQLLTAMLAIEMTFNKDEKFLYPNYDKIIFYKHPFPTPRIPQLHTVETHAEDGVIILSLDHMSAAIREPERYYNVGYHAFAEAYIHEYPTLDYPENLTWQQIEQISGFKEANIKAVLGLPAYDLLPIAMYLFFAFRERYQSVSDDSLDRVMR